MKINPECFQHEAVDIHTFRTWAGALMASTTHPKSSRKILAENLRILSQEASENIADDAAQIGIGVGTFRRALGHETGSIRLSDLDALARHLGVSPADLLTPAGVLARRAREKEEQQKRFQKRNTC